MIPTATWRIERQKGSFMLGWGASCNHLWVKQHIFERYHRMSHWVAQIGHPKDILRIFSSSTRLSYSFSDQMMITDAHGGSTGNGDCFWLTAVHISRAILNQIVPFKRGMKAVVLCAQNCAGCWQQAAKLLLPSSFNGQLRNRSLNGSGLKCNFSQIIKKIQVNDMTKQNQGGP